MPRILGTSPETADVLFPTSYKLDTVELTNHTGTVVDIQALVTDLKVIESIYTPSLLLSLNIKDPVNFLEEFQLSGQERIRIKMSRQRFGTTVLEGIGHEFLVTEYPSYGKFPNHIQAYIIKAISPFAYLSKFKKISRAFTGDVKDFIRDVLELDLGYDPESIDISPKDALHASFIVPNLAPLDAISWVLRRCFDETGSPWYCYETFDGIRIEPQSEMVRQSSYFKYTQGKLFTGNPYTESDYNQRKSRIVSIASDLRMSKYVSGASGAYASTSEYIDIATKTRSKKYFNYTNDYNQMAWLNPGKNNLSPKFGLEQKPLSDFRQAQINYIPTNSKSYANGQNYHSGTSDGRINRAQSYTDNLDNITHEMIVAGDFSINSGKVVELELPKSLDPSVTANNPKANYTKPFDDVLSGRYLVTAVSHNFSEEYTCDVKVKKDSMSVNYHVAVANTDVTVTND